MEKRDPFFRDEQSGLMKAYRKKVSICERETGAWGGVGVHTETQVWVQLVSCAWHGRSRCPCLWPCEGLTRGLPASFPHECCEDGALGDAPISLRSSAVAAWTGPADRAGCNHRGLETIPTTRRMAELLSFQTVGRCTTAQRCRAPGTLLGVCDVL